MHLQSPRSAILSAVIFNAIIIVLSSPHFPGVKFVALDGDRRPAPEPPHLPAWAV